MSVQRQSDTPIYDRMRRDRVVKDRGWVRARRAAERALGDLELALGLGDPDPDMEEVQPS